MKNNSRKKTALGCLVILIIITGALALAGALILSYYNDAIYGDVSNSDETVELQVNEGDTLISIIPALKDAGLIKSEEAFRVYLRLNSISPNIKYGQFVISKNINAIKLIEILEKGVTRPDLAITIKEGVRNLQVADLLKISLPENSKFSFTEFNNIVNNPDNVQFNEPVKSFLAKHKPSGASLEGYIFPDTYYINETLSAQEIVEKFLGNLITKLQAELDLDNLNLNQSRITSLFDALTLGSIIEKEANNFDNKALISGVFLNRLADDYLLQSDATVNYFTDKNEPGVDIADTQIDSPYNTYMYTGLPPGPINNPGINSIKAAFYPESTEYYFFFHDNNGNTYYSATYSEHLNKLYQYR